MKKLKVVALIVGLMLLSACFNSESKEREKFISFLNSHYINQKGSGVAELHDLLTKDIGRYVEHHKVFTFYHDEVDKKIRPPMEIIIGALGNNFNNYNNIPVTIATLKKSRENFTQTLADNEAIYEKALASKKALKMPGDLKGVYDKAFEKTVNRNHVAGKRLLGQLTSDVVDAAIELLEFVDANQDKIKIQGKRLELEDKAVHDKLLPLQKNFNAKLQAWNNERNEVKNYLRSQ